MRKNVAGQRVTFSLFKAGARIANPTLAVNDAKVALDGGAQNNVTTLPTSDAAGLVTWLPSQAETNADTVSFLMNDVLGAEWEPLTISFDTRPALLDTTQGAITWGQQKIAANVNGEGALDIRNANASGIGTYNLGGQNGLMNEGAANYGQYNVGGVTGQRDEGVADYGIEAVGGTNATNPDWAVAGDAMALTGAERTTTAMVIWNTLTAALVAVGSIGKYIVDYLALIWGKAALIGSGAAMTTTPVTASGNVSIIKGDSYLNADGRRLEWTNTGWNVAVGSTIMVIIQNVENFTGTRLSATSIGLELTTTQTAALTEGNFLFSVQEVKVGGERITLVQGVWESTVRPIPLT